MAKLITQERLAPPVHPQRDMDERSWEPWMSYLLRMPLSLLAVWCQATRSKVKGQSVNTLKRLYFRQHRVSIHLYCLDTYELGDNESHWVELDLILSLLKAIVNGLKEFLRLVISYKLLKGLLQFILREQ